MDLSPIYGCFALIRHRIRHRWRLFLRQTRWELDSDWGSRRNLWRRMNAINWIGKRQKGRRHYLVLVTEKHYAHLPLIMELMLWLILLPLLVRVTVCADCVAVVGGDGDGDWFVFVLAADRLAFGGSQGWNRSLPVAAVGSVSRIFLKGSCVDADAISPVCWKTKPSSQFISISQRLMTKIKIPRITLGIFSGSLPALGLHSTRFSMPAVPLYWRRGSGICQTPFPALPIARGWRLSYFV